MTGLGFRRPVSMLRNAKRRGYLFSSTEDPSKFSLPADSKSTSQAGSSSSSTVEGVRLVVMPLLAAALDLFCVCSSCRSGHVRLLEDNEQRQGLVSVGILVCEESGTESDLPRSSRRSRLHP